ncbi:MAG TPA: amino acid permease, partial [Gammaproteobacteria bacterium]|nr:amino acid permease [Gammaproteobacteria bacterium]
AYEGFQLLTYDYDDIASPNQTLARAVLSAIVIVTGVYILVALGTAMLIGADQVVEHKEIALAVAGREALGTAGLVIVTVAAAFSTGSAINSTLFATARLAHEVASNGELPAALDHTNRAGVPDRAVLGLGAFAAVLAVVGTLSMLVEAASLAFLFTFAVVCALACARRTGSRWVTGLGALLATAATVALIVRLARNEPLALAFLGVLVALAMFARPVLLRHVKTEQP